MKLHSFVIELHPRRAFRIARPSRTRVRNVFARIEADGISGHGEASPNAFYNETAEGVMERLAEAQSAIGGLKIRSVADVEKAWETLWPVVAPSRATQCALDLALWDWLAQREGVSVAELAWGTAPGPVRTFCTIGLSTPEELKEKTAELLGFPLIKIKSDQHADLAAVRWVREQSPGSLVAVDANCAWIAGPAGSDGEEARPAVDAGSRLAGLAEELQRLGVEFIEQPFPPEADPRLPRLDSGLPLFADESCVTEEDVERVAATPFSGFNIKLVKCGGLTPARRMACRGQDLGLKTMVGCMLESSVLIAAGAVIAQQTDYADLDGAWLLSDDPFSGWEFERGVLSPPTATGLGVARRELI